MSEPQRIPTDEEADELARRVQREGREYTPEEAATIMAYLKAKDERENQEYADQWKEQMRRELKDRGKKRGG